jgi:hypothetical protein
MLDCTFQSIIYGIWENNVEVIIYSQYQINWNYPDALDVNYNNYCNRCIEFAVVICNVTKYFILLLAVCKVIQRLLGYHIPEVICVELVCAYCSERGRVNMDNGDDDNDNHNK